MTRRPACRVCVDKPCDPALHAAHTSLRAWLRARVNAYLEPVVRGPRGRHTQHPVEAIGLVPRVIPHD